MAKIAEKFAGLFDKQRKAAREIADAIEAPRLEIMALREKRREVEFAPISPAESQVRIANELAHAESEVCFRFHPGAFVAPSDVQQTTDSNLRQGFAQDPLGIMLLLGFREEIVEALTRLAAKEAAGMGRAYTEAERSAKLAEIDTAIREAERQEEALCRAAEEAGVAVSRRADANMEFVLAEDL